MKNLLCSAAALLALSAPVFAQDVNCNVSGACADNSISTNLGDTDNSMNIGDHLNNTYSPDSASATGGSVGDVVTHGGSSTATGGASSSTGNWSSNDNKSTSSVGNTNQSNGSISNNVSGGNAAVTGGSNSQDLSNSGSADVTGGNVTGGTNTTTNNAGSIQTAGGAGGSGGAGGAGGKGGNSSSNSSSNGGTVGDVGNGSGNSKNKVSNAQGQDQTQSAKAKQGQSQSSSNTNKTKSSAKSNQTQSANNSGVNNSTTVDARNQSRYKTQNIVMGDINPIGEANSQDHCAMVRGGGFGVADGAIASGSVRWDVNDKACQVNRRTGVVQNLAGNDAALVYLAQHDPAVCAVLEYRGIGQCQKSAAGRNMRVPGENNVSKNRQNTRERGAVPTPVAAPASVCRIKEGSARTVVTNWDDKMACARSLGIAG